MIRLTDEPGAAANAFMALITNLELLQSEVVEEAPHAEAAIDKAVGEARRVILRAWRAEA